MGQSPKIGLKKQGRKSPQCPRQGLEIEGSVATSNSSDINSPDPCHGLPPGQPPGTGDAGPTGDPGDRYLPLVSVGGGRAQVHCCLICQIPLLGHSVHPPTLSCHLRGHRGQTEPDIWKYYLQNRVLAGDRLQGSPEVVSHCITELEVIQELVNTLKVIM